MKVYLKEHPRSLALGTDDYFLIFRYFGSDGTSGLNSSTASSSQTNLDYNSKSVGSSGQGANGGSGNSSGGGHHHHHQRPPFEAKCIAEFKKIEHVDVEAYVPLSRSECFGFLGLINIDRDIYLCTITRQAEVASPRQGDTICRIYGVEFHCLTKPDWDFVSLDANGYAIDVLNSPADQVEHPCTSIRKLLSNGSFYYSTNFDLTSVMQNR
ncbi:phosphatidylinositol-3-/phosphoinositide 5-phosphatase INP53 [Sugiyamaella lignohabitans]|uniref:Phosphatidylinositol-3-/phosphoinositide 5-phosphatase INP53 n=1 Tax=Sugiyamaella lignohabitans TaxID=796027 RepID=A0A161HHN6_9ASCO|nr:phosphatidylinositol-3-/phosphoinositide 5-phosphatase INP53 [Sugiyamaella lignohabitans]ANB15580.1 phosphatidylinositol-3-/phosphoinositide 5-phosphatase INP53 [Sugiyamaella lignohabitans]